MKRLEITITLVSLNLKNKEKEEYKKLHRLIGNNINELKQTWKKCKNHKENANKCNN